MAVGIYKITSPTNKVYIGQSWDLEDRKSAYKNCECIKQRKVYNSIKKYGWEAHTYEVLMNVSENVTQQMFDEIEQAYMDYYRNSGYELMNIREAGSRGKHHPETIELIRKSQIGKYVPTEVGKKISESKKNPSEEVRKNLSESSKKTWSDPEHRLRMSLAHKCKPLSEEHKANLKKVARRGEAHHNYGKPMDQETRDKISQSKTGSKWSEARRKADESRPPVSKETRQKLSERMFGAGNYKARAVLQFDMEGNFIKEWDCIMDIERDLGIQNPNITKCCKGIRKSAGNFIWKYKTDN